jgi:hypothetical protein
VLVKYQIRFSGSDVLSIRFPVIADGAGINGNRVSLGRFPKPDEHHFLGTGVLHAADIQMLETGMHGLTMIHPVSGIGPMVMIVLTLMISHAGLLL